MPIIQITHNMIQQNNNFHDMTGKFANPTIISTVIWQSLRYGPKGIIMELFNWHPNA